MNIRRTMVDYIGLATTFSLVVAAIYIGVELGGMFEEGQGFLTKVSCWTLIWLSIHCDHYSWGHVTKRKLSRLTGNLG